MNNQHFLIAIDGGGTKTVATLADLNGRIRKKAVIGPSNPNKVAMELAITRLGEAIKRVTQGVPKNKIGFVYIALAGSLERDLQRREQIKKVLLQNFPEFSVWRKRIKIDGDQKAAFRAGTDEKNGIVLIAGTGSIAMGWRGNKEAIAGGWDYILGDQGSAFWVGQKALRNICKELDGREPKIKFLTKLILKNWKIKTQSDLIKRIYQENLVETVASLAVVCDEAAKRGDRTAIRFLEDAGKQLGIAANTVIKKLGLRKKAFPCVLIGGMFKSEIVSRATKREIAGFSPKAHFIFPEQSPAIGAVKLALEEYINRVKQFN